MKSPALAAPPEVSPIPVPAPVAFQDVLAAMAEVDRLKSREELLAAEADLPARVADVTTRLKDVYAKQGMSVPEDVITRGVEQFFAQRLVFSPPPATLGTRLAPLWIYRGRILKIGASLTAAFLVLLTAGYFAVVRPARRARERERTAARQELELATTKLHAVEQLGTVVFSHVQAQLAAGPQRPAGPELVKAVELGEAKLSAGRAAFDEKLQQARVAIGAFAPPDRVTSDRAQPALASARGALESIEGAGRDLDHVSALSAQMDGLKAERASLETAWKRLDHPDLPAALRSTAEQTYARGLATVAAFGPAAEVRQAATKLHTLADAESALRALPAQIKAAAAEGRAISRDPSADAQIAAAERSGLAAVQTGDAAAAEKHIAALRALTARLAEGYILRIVHRAGEYTRFWRKPRANSAARNYYVVVEAVTDGGTLVPQKIRTEEKGTTETVSKWAERVDEATYESVGRDRQDDGIIQTNVFGRKEKGRLTPQFLLGPKSRGGDIEGGRISRWEYRP